MDFIKLENVSKKFSNGKFSKKTDIVAVNNVNLTLKKGETLGLVGESGSGKTTLGRGILDLQPFDSGKLIVNGVDVMKSSKKEKKEIYEKMQIIFQDPYSSLNPKMRAIDIVKEPLKNVSDKEAEKRAKDILELVGISENHQYKFPREFSGGQRQRIGIARAVINYPEFILCDEPTSALDVSIQAQILELLVKLQKEYDLTYLFISHDLSVVRYISDRIAIMYKGNIVEIGLTEQIFNNPSHDYTKNLINTLTVLEPEKARKMFDNKPNIVTDIVINDNDFFKEIEKDHFVRVNLK